MKSLSVFILLTFFSFQTKAFQANTLKFITRPTYPMMQKWLSTYSMTFPNHDGYSLSQATANSEKLMFFVPRKATVGQAVLCSPFNYTTTDTIVLSDLTNSSCIDVKDFVKFGYCFTDVQVTPKAVYLTLAWWRQPWSLYVAFN